MKRDELLQNRKLKILIEGESGAGKTYCAVNAVKGLNTLYIDIDDGAVEELLNLTDESLEPIDRRDIKDFHELMDVIKESINYDIVVFDLLYPHLRDWSRDYVKNKIIERGYYVSSGGKEVKVQDKELFELQGFLYGISNNKEKAVFKILRKLPCHIIALAYPLDDDKYKNIIRGFFDIVIKIYDGVNGREAKIIKVRGKPELENVLTKNYINAIRQKLLQK